ncbi:UNVERIFIED_CONTAM: hypothetical protein Slati_0668800 [Sesamum latifolium]|uniref:Proline-rich protein PRCC n=1 Tax=Sesamum latifolium TaxID=2727402 RepID=A0AAW2Y491_9LAMI
MDSLLANYASSDDEEREEQPPPAKPVKLEIGAGVEKDAEFLSESSAKRVAYSALCRRLNRLFSIHSRRPNPNLSITLSPKRSLNIKETLMSTMNKLWRVPSLNPRPLLRCSLHFLSPNRLCHLLPLPQRGLFSLGLRRLQSRILVLLMMKMRMMMKYSGTQELGYSGRFAFCFRCGRRSILETEAPASSVVSKPANDAVVKPNVGSLQDQSNELNYGYSSWSSESESHAYYGAVTDDNVGSAPVGSSSTGNYQFHEVYDHSTSLGGESYAYYGAYGVGSTAVGSVGTAGSDAGMNSNEGSYEAVDYSYGNGQHAEYTNYGGSYGDYGNDAQYENNWSNTTALHEVPGLVGNALPLPGKRGRKDVPPEIVEVKQDELMKNRPREDQVKLTGIAFGPAYQPTSTKGKPTKLHKRKHQIGSLYFDMRQKEMELAERRAKGYLTKAQTQAKYGW